MRRGHRRGGVGGGLKHAGAIAEVGWGGGLEHAKGQSPRSTRHGAPTNCQRAPSVERRAVRCSRCLIERPGCWGGTRHARWRSGVAAALTTNVPSCIHVTVRSEAFTGRLRPTMGCWRHDVPFTPATAADQTSGCAPTAAGCDTNATARSTTAAAARLSPIRTVRLHRRARGGRGAVVVVVGGGVMRDVDARAHDRPSGPRRRAASQPPPPCRVANTATMHQP
jgi:hypothetical protein